MTRLLSLALAALLCAGILLAPSGVRAEEGAAPKALTIAPDSKVEAALKQFKVDYKAKGVPKEDQIMQRDYALQQIANLQHPDVIKALGKVSKSGDPDLRMLALIYLGEQKALPHLAAKHILAAMKKDKKNVALLLTGLQALSSLQYLGARKEITGLLKHRDYAVKKEAIAAVGYIKDIRMLSEVLMLIGMKVETENAKQSAAKDKTNKKTGKEVVEEGYSWEGVDVTYDTGTSGDGDQQMAEKIGKEKLAKNKAQAEANAGKSSGGGISPGGGTGAGGSSTGGGRRGARSRSKDELIPHILRTLKRLTGEEFDKPSTIKKWLRINHEAVTNNIKVLDKNEKEQKAVRASGS